MNFCFDKLVIFSDSEYGTHIYFRHGYLDYELSYWTDEEDIYNIIDDINDLVKKHIQERND